VAAEIADSIGADIISSSLGYTTYDDPYPDHTFSELDGRTCVSTIGAVMATRKGILVVNSAGNSRAQPWRKIGAPADADSILAVAALSTDSVIASFSSPGPSADGRIKPDVSSLGVRTAILNTQGGISESNGTSFSCPLLAGLCASLWQSAPGLTNMQIRDLVLQVSHKFSKPDTNFGFGIPDFAKALTVVQGQLKVEGFTLYPNPSVNELYLNPGAIAGQVEFILLNSLGQRVSSTTLTVEARTRVDVSSLLNPALAKGTYFLKIMHTGGEEEKTVVIW
ncbi:MAG: S8 family peptidase, partial [Bacteroidota bacterium]